MPDHLGWGPSQPADGGCRCTCLSSALPRQVGSWQAPGQVPWTAFQALRSLSGSRGHGPGWLGLTAASALQGTTGLAAVYAQRNSQVSPARPVPIRPHLCLCAPSTPAGCLATVCAQRSSLAGPARPAPTPPCLPATPPAPAPEAPAQLRAGSAAATHWHAEVGQLHTSTRPATGQARPGGAAVGACAGRTASPGAVTASSGAHPHRGPLPVCSVARSWAPAAWQPSGPKHGALRALAGSHPWAPGGLRWLSTRRLCEVAAVH